MRVRRKTGTHATYSSWTVVVENTLTTIQGLNKQAIGSTIQLQKKDKWLKDTQATVLKGLQNKFMSTFITFGMKPFFHTG